MVGESDRSEFLRNRMLTPDLPERHARRAIEGRPPELTDKAAAAGAGHGAAITISQDSCEDVHKMSCRGKQDNAP
jgi:hypothetical protein